MLFKVLFAKTALKDFQSLPEKDKLFISLVIDSMEENLFSKNLNIKKLNTPFEGYRLRKGNLRILFTLNSKEIVIYSIKHRKDAYR